MKEYPDVCHLEHFVVIPQPGVPGERSFLTGVERSRGICFCMTYTFGKQQP